MDKDYSTLPISGMYESWFLDYASYVILERAVPAIEDGLKPVQRRILHAMKEMDDGRFNKVANVIGSTMQYHPHGDASIGDAIVNLGQKDLLIETQGNWGDIRTGDGAAAPRYIEARLSKFALDVVFNPKTTEWQQSYDGRKKEPVTLPIKFPLLLAQGVEGIAVGLSTKVLPHNFIELIDASIKVLQGKNFSLYPDFPTGGSIDVENYNGGKRGGKVKVRAKIEASDNKTLLIKEIPFGTTTQSLTESIVKANDAGKIKVKKITDNTAKDVEVEVQLASGQSPSVVIDALYAFTDCETSISPNACIIIDEKPHFLSVNEILEISTKKTVDLLELELKILKGELLEKILFSSLEKIFIENRIYRDIEECETWEAVIATIDKGLEPFKPQFYREITTDDIVRLTEIKIKRISKFDSFKADELMKRLTDELEQTEHHLNHLTDYAISYFKDLLEKYSKGRERKTVISTFDSIAITQVAANNVKLYVNAKDGFIGYGLKKDEFVCDCSDIDDIIVFRKDGKFVVTKISDKTFVGKGILHVEVHRKDDDRKVFNLIYLDGKTGVTRAKRFQILGITRDKEYDLTKGEKNSKVLYFTSNLNGEAELVGIYLSPSSKARNKVFEYDFSDLEIKGRGSQGNIVTKYPVKKIQLKKEGKSTLGAFNLYFDDATGRINKDSIGKELGEFQLEDQIICIYTDGNYEILPIDYNLKLESKKVALIEKFDTEKAISAVHFDGSTKSFYVKRFKVETSTIQKKFQFLTDHKNSKLILASTQGNLLVQIKYKEKSGAEKHDILDVISFVGIKGWKAIGNKLHHHKIIKLNPMSQS